MSRIRDPLDVAASIDAQAHPMSDLLQRFGSDSQAYVARIMALLGSVGEIAPPPLEVRLVA